MVVFGIEKMMLDTAIFLARVIYEYLLVKIATHFAVIWNQYQVSEFCQHSSNRLINK